MTQEYTVGQAVVYVDEFGRKHDALITAWWKQPELTHRGQKLATQPDVKWGEPCCNLLFVTGDEAKTDSYGRQTERRSSCVHKSSQTAHGNFWCWPDEQ